LVNNSLMQDMTRSLRYLFILLFLSLAGTAMAQSGEVSGTVVDDKKEPVIGAVIEVLQGGIVKGGNITDADGNYLVKPLDPGRYDVRVKMSSFKTSLVTGAIVSPSKTTTVNISLELDTKKLNEVVVVGYKVPLIDPNAVGGKTVTSEEIEKMPTRSTNEIASTTAGVYQKSGSSGLSVAGGRTEATKYIIDGVVVYNSRGINLSQNTVDQIQVLTSGLPAKYGDAIGGIINITTKGVSDKTRAGVLLEHSIDGYNHNLVNFNVSGPLYTKKNKDGIKEPVVGYFVGGDVYYDKDRRPSYGGNYVIKDEVKKNLEANPLRGTTTSNGVGTFRVASEYLTANDFEIRRVRPDAQAFEGRVNGKLDFKLADNLNLTFGGMFDYIKASRQATADPSGYRSWSYLTSDKIPVNHDYTGRAFLRLTQRFGKGQTPNEEKKPLISNAYYSLQADYQKNVSIDEDPDHKKNYFDYGYVGKFYTDYTSIYQSGVDTATSRTGIKLISDHAPVSTRFERSELNPVLANYTSQLYNLAGSQFGGLLPGDISVIKALGGMTNGQLPPYTYNSNAPSSPTWTSVGWGQNFYRITNVDQFSVSVDASFDLQPGKVRHAIEFGLYYQQQAQRFFGVTGASQAGGIWQYMRQLANSHITQSNEPTFIINGKRYTKDDVKNGIASPSPMDTILYDRVANSASQSVFDKNLRAKLGAGPTEYINIDALDPSTFSLSMFSADELLKSGNAVTNYWGYDYTGKRTKGQVNFNDFFTKKDANGNYTRDIGAYRPNYIAGYILDNFSFKDIKFNIGMRIDRFDANTKMLKDPYSLYEVKTVGNSGLENKLNGGVTPANIKNDYVVYVNSNESNSPTVIGYRNGDDWYDYQGRLIEDPTVLRNYSGGRDPQPLLVDRTTRITDTNYNPNTSFTDYKPQVNVMPRISFSFPVSDVSNFYAHYDVVVQRPSQTTTGIYATPADYFFLAQQGSGQITNNPGLKPEKIFDYEVGFQQELSKKSAITIAGFYKERKDMIQVRPYLFAWPITYYTFGNRDFSTTKGMTVTYDLRRTGNLRLNIAYTLQFAEGTGSSSNSSNGGSSNFVQQGGLLQNFIQAQLPNLRYSTYLDVDSRHIIATNVDYRFEDNDGPVIAGKHLLQNAGLNFIFRARSGEPYTRLAGPNEKLILGELSGARKPWHYGLDLKIDKDFKLAFGKKPAEGAAVKNPLSVNVYILIQNLLNTRDVLDINGFTGRPDDDGYITSPQGLQDVQKQSNAQSYIDLYNINGINPYNLGLPRRASVGLQFNF
jgi:outer membrane receptor protein involved in Fe transport